MAGSIIFTDALIRLTTSTGTDPITGSSTGIHNISAFVRRVRMTREMDEHDDTVMGMTAHSRVPGLESWTSEFEMLQEFDTAAAINVDKLLSDIIDSKAKCNVLIRPVSAAIQSSGNPSYTGQVRLFSHTPMDGAVGDLLVTSPSFRSAGNLSRLTSDT